MPLNIVFLRPPKLVSTKTPLLKHYLSPSRPFPGRRTHLVWEQWRGGGGEEERRGAEEGMEERREAVKGKFLAENKVHVLKGARLSPLVAKASAP